MANTPNTSSTSAAAERTSRPIRRTKSSLLAFKLREFLDTKDAAALDNVLANVPEAPSTPSHRRVPSADRQQPTPRPRVMSQQDCVWVDCFYYGFYMEKNKLPAFQASLRDKAVMPHMQHKQQAAAVH